MSITTEICLGVNFINILHVPFVPKNFAQKKLQSQNVTREKLYKSLSFKKFAQKMLMKLTTIGLI